MSEGSRTVSPDLGGALPLLRWVTPAVPVLLFAQVYADKLVPRPVGLAAVVVVALELAHGRAQLSRSGPAAWIGAYVVLALASGWWAVSIAALGTQLLGVLVEMPLLLAFATLLTRPHHLRPILTAALIAPTLSGAYAIGTFVSGSVARVVGFEVDPNLFALYQLMALPFALVALSEVRRVRTRRLCGFAVAVILTSVLMTLSRGGLIALGVVVVGIVARPATLGLRIRRATMLVAVALTVLAAFAFVSGPLLSRLSNPDEAGGSGRVNEWRVALVALERHPVLGLGYGGYAAAAPDLLPQTLGVDLRKYPPNLEPQRAHNVYLETAAELGLTGLAIVLGILLSTAIALRRAARRADRLGEPLVARTARAALVALAAWATGSIFLSTLPISAVWAVVGLAFCLPAMVGAPTGASASEARLAAGDDGWAGTPAIAGPS